MSLSRTLQLLAVIALAACSAPADHPVRAERTDSAGILIITNRGEDRLLDLVFTPRLTLGGKDSGPESFFRIVRGSVSVDGSGNIHVLDFEAKTIAIFDSAGNFLRSLGGPGEGPGELEFPNTVRTTDDGTVSVFDFSKDGIVRWGPDGSVMPSVRIKATSPVQDIAFTGEGILYSWTNYANDAKTERTVFQLERPDTVEDLAAIDRPQPNMLEFKGCGIMMRLPPLFSPEIAWSTNGRRIASASKVEYEIAVRDS